MKNALTNEALRAQFQNTFVMTQFAIQVARLMVKRGEVVTLHDVLKQVKEHPLEEYLEELEEQEDME